MNNQKTKLYIDLDDTVLKSSEAVIKILNNKYGLHKTIANLKDWKYRDIYPMSEDQIEDIYASDEFFDIVEVDDGFKKFYDKFKDVCEFYIVSLGNIENLKKKREFISKLYPEFIFCDVVPREYAEKDFQKSHIDMNGGYQIDDRCDCLLDTNAKYKLLLTHGVSYDWNRPEKYSNVEGLYTCRDWKDISDIIEFFIKCDECF